MHFVHVIIFLILSFLVELCLWLMEKTVFTLMFNKWLTLMSDLNNQDLNIDQNNLDFCHNQAALEVTLWWWLFQV